jgi:hypothetical protein
MLRTRDDQKKLRDILEIIHTQKADMQQLMSYKSLMVIYSTLIIEDGQTLQWPNERPQNKQRSTKHCTEND